MTHDEGRRYALELLIRSGLVLRLFAVDREPKASHTLEHYREPEGGGYAPIHLPLDGWAFGKDGAAYPRQTFVFSGEAGQIYGWLITSQDGIVMEAEQFRGGPHKIARRGDRIEVVPKLRGG